MADLRDHIVQLLGQYSDNTGKSIGELFQKGRSEVENLYYEELLQLWREGKIYVSDVERETRGYVPTKSSKWSIHQLPDYFTLNKSKGIFQIPPEGILDRELELEATISVSNAILSLATSPDGKLFIIGDKDGRLFLGDMSAGKIKKEITGHKGKIWNVAFSNRGDFIISVSEDGTINKWSSDLKNKIETVKASGKITSLEISTNDKSIVTGHKISETSKASVQIWQTSDLDTDSSFYHHEKNVYCVAILLGGKEIISGDSNSTLIHYSLEEDRVLMTDKQAGTVFCVEVSPNEDFAVSGGQYGVMNIYDLGTQKVVRSIDAHTSRVSSLSISKSGDMIASGGKDSRIALWDLNSGKQIANVLGHSGWVRGLAFTSNDLHLLSGGSDGELKIWRIT